MVITRVTLMLYWQVLVMLSIVTHGLANFGHIYAPAGDGPFPMLLILHGSEGGWSGWSARTATFFAAHGFAAYYHAYSKGGNLWNAGEIRDIPLDNTVDAITTLKTHPLSNGKIGIYGISRGGEHALLLTSLMARDAVHPLPDAVATHSAPSVICGAFDAKRWRDRGDPGWQVWRPQDRAWTWKGSSEDLTPTILIEIERYSGPLFLSHGTHDSTWDVSMLDNLEERLLKAGRSPEIHRYKGQGHGPFAAKDVNAHHLNLLSFFSKHLED
ncbi:MAG: alpha/beta hydrolase [Pseudomonadota bacterium]